MHLSAPLLLVLPILAAGQAQIPLGENLQAWFEKAKSYLPTAATNPIASTSAKAAAKNIVPLTKDNWRSELSASPSRTSQHDGPETWMVFVSGTNKTCYGLCGDLEVAWNKTAALFAADPTAPKLGYINCDTNAILCAIWAARPPSIWHIQLPVVQKDQSRAATTVRILKLNATTTTAKDMMNIHAQKTYQKADVYEGAFQPFDGWLAQTGLATPLGYAMFGFSLVPTWGLMLLVSFVSRSLM